MPGQCDNTSFHRLKSMIQQDVSAMIADLGREPTEEDLTSMISRALAESGELGLLKQERLNAIERDIVNDMLHLGPLQPLLDDASVTEICVNTYDKVFVERGGIMEAAEEIAFDSEQHVRRIIDHIALAVDRRIDEQSPRLDARMHDGSRVNAVIPPIAIDGSSLTIRRFPETRMTTTDLIANGSASPSMLDFLAAAVRGRCSIVVAGGTGGGKTTLLNILSENIPSHERIVTIEDTAELKLHHDNLVRLEARPPNVEGSGEITVHDLMVNSLRMRPDRIIVGECRKDETLEMIRAMTTGHDGSLTTVHADDVPTAFHNLEGMMLETMPSYGEVACRRKIAQAVDLIVVVNRFIGGARIIESVTAVTGMEGETIQTEPLFVFEQSGVMSDGSPSGVFRGCGIQQKGIVKQIEQWGVDYDPVWMFDKYERQGKGGTL